MPAERVVYEVERDSGGLMFSAPLAVGECVRVVPEACEVELAEALRAMVEAAKRARAGEPLPDLGGAIRRSEELLGDAPRSLEVVPLGTQEALREMYAIARRVEPVLARHVPNTPVHEALLDVTEQARALEGAGNGPCDACGDNGVVPVVQTPDLQTGDPDFRYTEEPCPRCAGARALVEGVEPEPLPDCSCAMTEATMRSCPIHGEDASEETLAAWEAAREVEGVERTPTPDGPDVCDETCRRCGSPNVVWSAASPLWNAVMRGGSIDGPWEYGEIICPTCFMVLAEERGIATRFTVDAREVHVELETVTPSGRVWDPKAFMWVEPGGPSPSGITDELVRELIWAGAALVPHLDIYPAASDAEDAWDKAELLARMELAGERTHTLVPNESGAGLIAAERRRQVEQEGWTPEHDDTHDHGEIVSAAIAYAEAASQQGAYTGRWPHPRTPPGWPWEPEAFKQHGRVEDLTTAGALIAAEIDRLSRVVAARGEHSVQWPGDDTAGQEASSDG